MNKKLLVLTLPLLAVLSLSNCSKDDDSGNAPQKLIGPSNNNSQSNVLVDGVTVSGKVGNYTYVDLGLPSGTKWATYNVGAAKPTEYGDYFAWGETKPKDSYSWENYKLCNGTSTSQTKYCTSSSQGTVDNKKVLDPKDDAATMNWGIAWRMPTTEEQEELIEGCDWQWVEDFNGSGMNGLLGTSKENGAIIFLLASGFYGEELSKAGSTGYFWSSSVYEVYSYDAYFLGFYDGDIDEHRSRRYNGRSVRAVLR